MSPLPVGCSNKGPCWARKHKAWCGPLRFACGTRSCYTCTTPTTKGRSDNSHHFWQESRRAHHRGFRRRTRIRFLEPGSRSRGSRSRRIRQAPERRHGAPRPGRPGSTIRAPRLASSAMRPHLVEYPNGEFTSRGRCRSGTHRRVLHRRAFHAEACRCKTQAPTRGCRNYRDNRG